MTHEISIPIALDKKSQMVKTDVTEVKCIMLSLREAANTWNNKTIYTILLLWNVDIWVEESISY